MQSLLILLNLAMKWMLKITLIVSSMFTVTLVYAQKIQGSGETDPKHFTVHFDYLSDYLVNGRKDSLRSPYAIAGIEAATNNGLTVNANLYYLLQKNNRKLDFLELLVAYEKDISDQIQVGFYGTKYFSAANRNTLNSDINASLGLGVTYDLPFITFFTQADWLINTQSDFSLTVEMLKEFEIQKGSFAYSISPQIDMYFSTLGFYGGTITKNSQRRNGRPLLTQPAYVTTTVVNPKFQWMGLEMSIPFTIENENWGISFTPTLACPVNPVHTVSVVTFGNTNLTLPSTPYSERVMHPSIYTNLSFYIKF